MKLLRNTIFHKINYGYSLIEMVIAIAVATLLMSSIIISSFILHRGFLQARNNASKLYEMSKFSKLLAFDVLNPDIHPHHPKEEYKLSDNSITFFANNGMVKYSFENKTFGIERNENISTYNFIKDFQIQYYDKDGYEYFSLKEHPYSCELIFVFNDKKEIILGMRL